MLRKFWAKFLCWFVTPRCQLQGFCVFKNDCPVLRLMQRLEER